TTTTTRAEGLDRPGLLVAAVLALAAAVLLPALGDTRETASHEGLYGVLGREVAEGRAFFAPRFGGASYREKPPAFFWAVGLAGLHRRGRGSAALAGLSGVALALAVLVKGPIALAFFAFFLGAVVASGRAPRERLARTLAGCGGALAFVLAVYTLGVVREAGR